MKFSLEESLSAWEANAGFWDEYMGDASNGYHRDLVAPGVTALLDIRPDDFILDIGCGNGNYSAFIAKTGASVLAFDYSENMIALAKKRRSEFASKIEFCVADASNEASLMSLKRECLFTKAVSNMALMDITDISALFHCVSKLIKLNGVFVFSTQHPCFVTLTDKYLTAHGYYGEAIPKQPRKQCYYHRSLQDIFKHCFKNGFVIDGFIEKGFQNSEMPELIIVRARKTKEIA